MQSCDLLVKVFFALESQVTTTLFVLVVVFVLKTRNPDVVWRRNFGVGFFCPDLDALQSAFFLWLPQKDQVVLVVEVFLEAIEVGFEADRVGGAPVSSAILERPPRPRSRSHELLAALPTPGE